LVVYFTNNGNLPLASGTSIGISYTVNSGTNYNQTLVLSSALNSGSSVPYTLSGLASQVIQGPNQFSIHATLAGDINASNNNATAGVNIKQKPTIELGPDVQFSESHTFDAGSGFSSYLWNDGSTSRTLTVTSTGKVKVTVTNAVGCSASDSVFATKSTGFDNKVASTFALYPNPAGHSINISFNSESLHNPIIEIITIDKKILKNFLFEDNLKAFNQTLDISSLSNGMYYIRVSDQNGRLLYMTKFVKQE
jgi:hypothetical protein